MCRGQALSVSGPGALCVGARRSLSGPGALCFGARRSPLPFRVWGPDALCVGPLFVRAPGAVSLSVSVLSALCVAARRFVSGPCGSVGPQLRYARPSACHPSIRLTGPRPSSDQLASAPIRVAHIQSRPSAPIRVTPPSSDPRATHPARRVPFFQERTPNLIVWGIYIYIYILYRIPTSQPTSF